MALSVEASELVEIFQWLTQEESKNIDYITYNIGAKVSSCINLDC